MDDNTMKDADKEMIEKLSLSDIEIILKILNMIQAPTSIQLEK